MTPSSSVKVHNTSRGIRYIDAVSGHLKDFHQAQASINLSKNDFNNYASQSMSPLLRPNTYLPIGGHFVAPPRTNWQLEDGRLSYHRTDGIEGACAHESGEKLISTIRRYTALLKGQRAAVELSGGLDSTLVVRMLRLVGAEPSLIGFQSDRYEFRTEREIQNHLMSESRSAVLLDDHVSLFTNLQAVPPHPMPSISSLFYDRHRLLANAAESLGVSYVLSGVGGDSLLVDEVATAEYPSLDRLFGWEFNDLWSQDVVYRPLGIHHYCPYSFRHIARILHAMRFGECRDDMKLWARKKFAPYLPRELSMFAYKASHDGLYAAAIKRQSSYILAFMRCAYERCGLSALAPESIKPVLENWPLVDQRHQQLFLIKLSFGVWVNSNNLAR